MRTRSYPHITKQEGRQQQQQQTTSKRVKQQLKEGASKIKVCVCILLATLTK